MRAVGTKAAVISNTLVLYAHCVPSYNALINNYKTLWVAVIMELIKVVDGCRINDVAFSIDNRNAKRTDMEMYDWAVRSWKVEHMRTSGSRHAVPNFVQEDRVRCKHRLAV